MNAVHFSKDQLRLTEKKWTIQNVEMHKRSLFLTLTYK